MTMTVVVMLLLRTRTLTTTTTTTTTMTTETTTTVARLQVHTVMWLKIQICSWRYYCPSQCYEWRAHWHGITSQQTWVFSSSTS